MGDSFLIKKYYFSSSISLILKHLFKYMKQLNNIHKM